MRLRELHAAPPPESALLTLAGDAAADLLAAWPDRICHLRAALERFSHVLRLGKLEGHAHLGELPYVRAKRWTDDGAGKHRRDLLNHQEVVAWTHGQGAGTLVLDGCIPWQQGQGDFVERLAQQLAVPTPSTAQVNLFACREGGQTRPHFDCQEVIILQVHGSKHWCISPRAAYAHPSVGLLNAAKLPRLVQEAGGIMPLLPTTWEEITLTPGDLLFLPRGCWHAASALQDSVSLTFSFATATVADVIGQQLANALRSWAPFRAVAKGHNDGCPDEQRMTVLAAGLAAEQACEVDQRGA